MLVVNDALDAVLIGAFFFGLIFSALSLFLGFADFGLGHGGGHDFGGHLDHGGHGGHDAGHDGVPPISIGTVLAFLTWFGGVAYLARNGFGAYAAIAVLVGIGGGLAGGYMILWLLRKVRSQEAGLLRTADYQMPGTVARVTSSIRVDGTGEIVYERRGVRQFAAARSSTGEAIARGVEVVVHGMEGGIARVEPWSSYVGDEFDDLPPVETPAADATSSAMASAGSETR